MALGLGIVENILDSAQPHREFRLLVALADLVFPVGRKALLGDLVHAAAAYLHLHPVAVMAHHREVERLISRWPWPC